MQLAPIPQFIPATPTPRRVYTSAVNFPHKPFNCSPLTSPDTSHQLSPAFAAQSRRREQYKCKNRSPVTPASSSARNAVTVCSSSLSGGSVFASGGNRRAGASGTRGGLFASPESGDAKRNMLREKLKARCVERAIKARKQALHKKRYAEPSSDGWSGSSDIFGDAMVEDDVEESLDDIMQGELFQRLLEGAARRERHSYRVSYEREVGSSFDPNLEDAAAWEAELKGPSMPLPDNVELPPEASLDEELDAYLEEYAALAEFEDLPEELLAWDGDVDDETAQSTPNTLPDQQMDVTA